MEKYKITEFVGYPGSGKTTIAEYFLEESNMKFKTNKSLGGNFSNSAMDYVITLFFNIRNIFLLYKICYKTKVDFYKIFRIFISYRINTRKKINTIYDQGIVNFCATSLSKGDIDIENTLNILNIFITKNNSFIKVQVDPEVAIFRIRNRSKNHFLKQKTNPEIVNFLNKYEYNIGLITEKLELNVLVLDDVDTDFSLISRLNAFLLENENTVK